MLFVLNVDSVKSTRRSETFVFLTPCCLFVVSFGEAMSTYWLINDCKLSLNLVTIYET